MQLITLFFYFSVVTNEALLQAKVDILQEQVRDLNKALQLSEVSRLRCQDMSTSPSPSFNYSDHKSALEEFLSFFSQQYQGIILGTGSTMIFHSLDQKFALWYARKNNLKQKTIASAWFPTIICLIQLFLRARSKNSKLADALSALKKPQTPSDPSNQQQQSPLTSQVPPRLSSLSSEISDGTTLYLIVPYKTNNHCPKIQHIQLRPFLHKKTSTKTKNNLKHATKRILMFQSKCPQPQNNKAGIFTEQFYYVFT